MGTLLLAWNKTDLLDKMAAAHGRRSGQALVDSYDSERISVRKFARLNGTGEHLYRDKAGNLIGVVGFAGIASGEDAGWISDPKGLLETYLQSRDDVSFAERLQGNFSLIVYLNRRQQLKVFRDYANSINFYSAACGDGVYLGNSSLALREFIPSGINLFGAASLLSFVAPFENLSVYDSIEKLAPGRVYTWNAKGERTEEEYGALPEDVLAEAPDPKVLGGLFANALRLILSKCDRPSVDLTGGYDTRLVTAAALQVDRRIGACVHGEDDGEVRFVLDRIAPRLGIECKALRIGLSGGEGMAGKAIRWHYLFDGEYSIFDAYKEGERSAARMEWYDSKITGGIGEYLRDKWYSRFRQLTNTGEMRDALQDFFVSFYCRSESPQLLREAVSDSFLHFILHEYRETVRSRIREHFQRLSSNDAGYLYLYVAYMHYIRGWLGTLYNAHNRILLCGAPYQFQEIIRYALPRNSVCREHAAIQLAATNWLWPDFALLPLIDGTSGLGQSHTSRARAWRIGIEKRGRNLLNEIRRRVLNVEPTDRFKVDYDYRSWFNRLMEAPDVKNMVIDPPSATRDLIHLERWPSVVAKASDGRLSAAHYRTIGRIVSLMLSHRIAEGGIHQARQ